LPSHRRKLAWAESHIEEIERLIQSWREGNPYRVAMQPDSDGGAKLVGEQLNDLPDSLGLVIGDALQALRSALDNLAFALALMNNPAMTAEEQQDVSFPIFDRPASVGHKSIKQMDGVVQGKVLGLCPDPARSPVADDPLWLLNKANNRDKHRAITVAALSVANHSITLSGTMSGPGFVGPGGPQRTRNKGDQVVFARFGPGSQVQTQVSATLVVAFDEGSEVADRPVPETLRWFHGHIRDVVFKALEPHL
jgi:hypothetical protein